MGGFESVQAPADNAQTVEWLHFQLPLLFLTEIPLFLRAFHGECTVTELQVWGGRAGSSYAAPAKSELRDMAHLDSKLTSEAEHHFGNEGQDERC